MEDFEIELKQGFLEEAAQGLSEVEQSFLELEKDPNNIETINKIFRLAHNLKGSSRAVGFDHMGDFTHAFESFILKAKNGEMSVTPQVINVMLQVTDHLRSMVEAYQADLNASIDSSQVLSLIQNYDPSQDISTHSNLVNEPILESDSPVAHQIEEVTHSQEDGLLNEATRDTPLEVEKVETASSEQDFSSSSSSVCPTEQEPSNVVPMPTPPAQNVMVGAATQDSAQPPSSSGGHKSPGGATDQSIRVSLSKVEQLINFVGEMVILQSVLREQLSGVDLPIVHRSLNQLTKVSKEIQDLAMGLRMVPIKPTFQKMVRIVRDTARVLEKEIEIELEGEETELDKTVLERITDPLVHLVRNAADHGIERPEIRKERGKPRSGRVVLRAYHKSGRLMIEIEDDGNGLDPEKLKKKAIEKGILKSGVTLSDTEAYQLIFAPGFSTKDQVTDISGRGVGMDVVRTNISEIGGDISIDSQLGKGTKFIISLPLTLAIIDAMISVYGSHRFVIPVNHVYETLKVDSRLVSQTTELGDVLTLRGEPMPIYRLGDFFGLATSGKPTEEMIAIVNRSSRKPFALIVEDILGQGQVVIKQLTPELQGVHGVSGVTILGDGRPAFIIEPQEIIKRKLQKTKPLFSEAV